MRLTITKTVTLPNPVKLARLARSPELGPGLLFFSGGSALNPLSRVMTRYTHNSVHLITPFDSGGSSAKLRRAFKMPAVGDLRNRLIALADETVTGNPEVGRLFSHRLPKDESPDLLLQRLDRMVDGRDELTAAVPDPLRKIIRSHLGFFRREMPDDFDLRGASIGNLVLTGGYINNDRRLDPVCFLFSKLAEVRGMVRPVINQDLHLVSELEDGSVLVGQHLLTGREVPPIESPVRRIYLTDDRNGLGPVLPEVREKTSRLIRNAELIVYPMGSLYSSVIANLLPRGAAGAVAANDCPKVFIPNTGLDPETPGLGPADAARELLRYLKEGAGRDAPVRRLLNFVLVDSENGAYPEGVDVDALERLGVQVIDTHLASADGDWRLDPEALLGVLLSLA